ncbi:MAG: LCP family protein [Oscillibacter sp.]|uniref:LCP family protein n=1 Tax=Oscillibacter sp. TaxID=1945593 RepID=UPI00216F958B|nr:LCP family protein [Oscillibacter sp.]MCI9113476.1 LCP family protein [Oscillibacter sp.]
MASRLRRRKRSPWLVTLLLLFILIGLCYAVVRVYFRAPDQKAGDSVMIQRVNTPAVSDDLSDEEAEALRSHYERKPQFWTILVSGADDGNGKSDTNILVSLDVENGQVFGVSIARDTKAFIQGKNRKLNAAYGLGGVELLADTVSDQLGIPVDYTVLVDLKAFQALVDTIGGVDFYIPVDMHYEDPYQDLSIHFSKGMRHLSGEEALKVVRCRSAYASQDIGRMQTQQDFLKAVAKQLMTPEIALKLPDLCGIFINYVETDLNAGNLAWLGGEVLNMGMDNISFATLPGEWHDPYIYLDQEEVLAMVNEHLNPYTEDRTAEDLNILT